MYLSFTLPILAFLSSQPLEVNHCTHTFVLSSLLHHGYTPPTEKKRKRPLQDERAKMATSRYSKFPSYMRFQTMAPAIGPLAAAEEEVEHVVEKYANVTSMHPSLEAFGKRPEYFRLFTKVFNHHVCLVKARPQELELGYITVYDKALMRLTDRGQDMFNKGAVSLFLEEILGVSKKDRVEDLEIVLKGNVALRSALLEGMHSLTHLTALAPAPVLPKSVSQPFWGLEINGVSFRFHHP